MALRCSRSTSSSPPSEGLGSHFCKTTGIECMGEEMLTKRAWQTQEGYIRNFRWMGSVKSIYVSFVYVCELLIYVILLRS